MLELINKIKFYINKAKDIEIAGYSLKELDSRVTAIPLAGIVTVFLFLVMQALVTSNEYDIGDEGVNINISFLRQLQDTETQTAKKKPNRPEQEQEPDPPEMDIPETPRPEMSADSVTTPEFGGPAFGSFAASTDQDVLPIVKVPPQYPREASKKGIEGWVLLEFTITPSGAVVNPFVVDSEPPGTFDRSALRTIVKWKYKPWIKDGKAIQRDGVQHLVTYELGNANESKEGKVLKRRRPPPSGNRDITFVDKLSNDQLEKYNKYKDSDALIKYSFPPAYPKRATQRGIQGWVLTEHTVTPEGNVVNPVVIDAEPPGIFNRSALRTIVQWKYLPAKRKGKAITRPGVRNVITYSLEDAKKNN